VVCDLDQGNPILSSTLDVIGLPFEIKSIGAFIESLKEMVGLSMVTYISDRYIWMPFSP